MCISIDKYIWYGVQRTYKCCKRVGANFSIKEKQSLHSANPIKTLYLVTVERRVSSLKLITLL